MVFRWVSGQGSFPKKAAFAQNPIVAQTVCQMHQVGNRGKTQNNFKVHGFSKQNEPRVFEEKEGGRYEPGGLARERLLNV